MADRKNKDKDAKDSSSGKSPLIGWIVTFVVAFAGAAGGYGLSGLFAKVSPDKEALAAAEEKAAKEFYLAENFQNSKAWIYEMEPITANLNEPGGARMIQFAAVMELSKEMDEEKGREFLDGKKVYLQDWLGEYIAGQKLVQVKGSSGQSRLKVDIEANFNKILFPDSKPLIQKVMLKGFIIQ